MSVSFFDNKAVTPDDKMVAEALNDTYSLWVELQDHIQENYPNITKEWKHYGKASGWTQKVISGKRNLLFFIPQNGCFRIRIVLGDKAASCAEASEFPDEIKDSIRNAIPYAEGRSLDLDISNQAQLGVVKRLLEIKLVN